MHHATKGKKYTQNEGRGTTLSTQHKDIDRKSDSDKPLPMAHCCIAWPGAGSMRRTCSPTLLLGSWLSTIEQVAVAVLADIVGPWPAPASGSKRGHRARGEEDDPANQGLSRHLALALVATTSQQRHCSVTEYKCFQ